VSAWSPLICLIYGIVVVELTRWGRKLVTIACEHTVSKNRNTT